ncbi:MAG: isochorismate synthase [bacterium]
MAPKISQIPIAAEAEQALAALDRALSASGERRKLVVVTVDCESRDLLEWLARTPQAIRTYWRGREGHLEIAGCGEALKVVAEQPEQYESAFAKMTQTLQTLPADVEARWLGGICYDPARAYDDLWSGFPRLWFVMPEITITRRDDRYQLTLALRQGESGKREQLEERLLQLFDPGKPEFQVRHTKYERQDIPAHNDWLVQIEQARLQMKAGELDKVVLARRSDLRLAEPLEPTWFVEQLRIANRSGYTFMLQPQGGNAFVGAPPERLFKIKGRELFTEAIAGTRPISESEAETERYAAELRHSDKDSAEHSFVVSAIKESLAPLCEDLKSAPEPEIMRLGTVQHLRLPLQGRLKPDVGIAELLRAMHPTPAVGGTPRTAALEFIRETEAFTRGWYAAPVGYLGRDTCEFAVAIRSALLHANGLSLFAGAGIVAASEAEAEWQELEQKIVAPLRVLRESR